MMKSAIPALVFLIGILFIGLLVYSGESKLQDPVVNLRLTMPQASSIVYSLRYTTILDAKTANELADLVINQINDTTLNRQLKLIPPAGALKKN